MIISKFYNVQQGSEEWFALRVGKITASNFADMFSKETTAAFQDIHSNAACEQLFGADEEEGYKSELMQRGNDLEPIAREIYENINQVEVTNGGFFELNEFIGASPDGLVGEKGIIEIKCPLKKTWFKYAIDDKLPSKYYWQVYGQLYVTGRQWCDFIAYHPTLGLFVKRVERDEVIMAELENRINLSIEIIKNLKTKYELCLNKLK